MNRVRSQHLAFMAFLLLALPPGCSGGNDGGGGFGQSASMTIGAAGGMLGLPGGGGTLVVPAGALAADSMVTITVIDPALIDPSLAGTADMRAFEISPAGLSLLQPATLIVDNPLAPTQTIMEGASASSQVAVDLKLIEVENAVSSPPQLDFDIDLSTGATTVRTDLDAFGRALIRNFNGPYMIVFNYPTSIEAGVTETIQVEVLAQSGYAFNATPSLSWQGPGGGTFAASLGPQTSPFAPGTPAPTVVGTAVADSFTISCSPGAPPNPSPVYVYVIFDDLRVAMDTVLGAEIRVYAKIGMGLDIDCKSTLPPGVSAVLVSANGILDAVEGMTRLPQGLSCKGPNGLDIAVAGAEPGTGNPMTVIVDPVAGLITDQFPLPGGGGIGASFDSNFILPPAGAVGLDPALITTGNGSVLKFAQPGCNLSAISALGFPFYPDTSVIAGDPSLGIASAQAGGIDLTYMDITAGGPFTEQIPLGNTIRSVIGNAARDGFLAIRDTGQLIQVDWNGTTATETPLVVLGSNPRRMRWDPVSQIGGITDFSDDTVTVFSWDGSLPPFVIGTANVGDGPVGLDVLNGKIVCSGFNDGSYSIITIDTVQQLIVGTTTTPNPFPAGLAPGHAIFLGDPDNSIAISYNGNASIGILPNAFP